MTAQEIVKLIKDEIAAAGKTINSHGVDLNKCLALPRKVKLKDSFSKNGSEIELWLVLEESPGSSEGYQIVFSEKEKSFGLAKNRVFISFYGKFLETLAGM